MHSGPWKRGIQQAWKYLHDFLRGGGFSETQKAMPSPCTDKYGLIPLSSPARPPTSSPLRLPCFPSTSGKSSCICFAWQHTPAFQQMPPGHWEPIATSQAKQETCSKGKAICGEVSESKDHWHRRALLGREEAWNHFMPTPPTPSVTLSWPWGGENVPTSVLTNETFCSLWNPQPPPPPNPEPLPRASVGQFRATRIYIGCGYRASGQSMTPGISLYYQPHYTGNFQELRPTSIYFLKSSLSPPHILSVNWDRVGLLHVLSPSGKQRWAGEQKQGLWKWETRWINPCSWTTLWKGLPLSGGEPCGINELF